MSSMAFRKRNINVGQTTPDTASKQNSEKAQGPGVRPSFLTSQPTTSTGSASLDSLLGGHGGLALGSSLLIGENGTTDYAGTLLRYYAAEGICHGHTIHIVGAGPDWVRELPGVVEQGSSSWKVGTKDNEEKMKIAWRYEKLGQAGERALPDRSIPTQASSAEQEAPFCHTFDLTKRLEIPQGANIQHIPLSAVPAPFDPILRAIAQSLRASPQNNIHRLIMPTILRPALYSPRASYPENFVRFLHSLRGLLRRYVTQLTAVVTLPLGLYPRKSGLVCWAEILSDGVLELIPFPHSMDASDALAESGSTRGTEEQPQGMLKVHKIPITTDRGEGGAGAGNSIGEDLAFTVSRRKFVIKPFSLPPLEGDQDAQKEAGKLTAKDVEF